MSHLSSFFGKKERSHEKDKTAAKSTTEKEGKKVPKEGDKREKDKKVSRDKEGARGSSHIEGKPPKERTSTATPSTSSSSPKKTKKDETSEQDAAAKIEWERVQASLNKTSNSNAYPPNTGGKYSSASSLPKTRKTKKDETSEQDAAAKIERERMNRERRPYGPESNTSTPSQGTRNPGASTRNTRENVTASPKPSKGLAQGSPAPPKPTTNTTRQESGEGNGPKAKTGPAVAGKSIVADTRNKFPKDKEYRKEFPGLGFYQFESEQLKEKRMIAIRPEKDKFDDKEFEQGKVIRYRTRPGDWLYLVEKNNLKKGWPVKSDKESWSVSVVFNKDEYGLVLLPHDTIKAVLFDPSNIKEKDLERF